MSGKTDRQIERLIDGPAYPSHARPAAAVAVKELEDVPGCVIPTEPLRDTREFRACNRRQERLFIAARLLAGAIPDTTTLAGTNGHAKIAADAVRLADMLMRENDEYDSRACQPFPSSAPIANPVPLFDSLPADQRKYLSWLANYGPVPTSAYPVEIGPEVASVARRLLQKAGLIETCPWEDTHGFKLSAIGVAVVESKRNETRGLAA